MTPLDRLRALHAALDAAEDERTLAGSLPTGSQYRLARIHQADCSVFDARAALEEELQFSLPSLLACVDALRSLYPDHPALAPLVKEEP